MPPSAPNGSATAARWCASRVTGGDSNGLCSIPTSMLFVEHTAPEAVALLTRAGTVVIIEAVSLVSVGMLSVAAARLFSSKTTAPAQVGLALALVRATHRPTPDPRRRVSSSATSTARAPATIAPAPARPCSTASATARSRHCSPASRTPSTVAAIRSKTRASTSCRRTANARTGATASRRVAPRTEGSSVRVSASTTSSSPPSPRSTQAAARPVVRAPRRPRLRRLPLRAVLSAQGSMVNTAKRPLTMMPPMSREMGLFSGPDWSTTAVRPAELLTTRLGSAMLPTSSS